MKLKVRKYRNNSLMVILPKNEFFDVDYVYIYKEEKLSDSEILLRLHNQLNQLYTLLLQKNEK